MSEDRATGVGFHKEAISLSVSGRVIGGCLEGHSCCSAAPYNLKRIHGRISRWVCASASDERRTRKTAFLFKSMYTTAKLLCSLDGPGGTVRTRVFS